MKGKVSIAKRDIQFNSRRNNSKLQETLLKGIRENIDSSAYHYVDGPLGGYIIKGKRFNIEEVGLSGRPGYFFHDGSNYENVPFYSASRLKTLLKRIQREI